MDTRDEGLIKELLPNNDELKQLIEEHRDLEERLASLEKRRYLTPSEQLDRKRIQKTKLAGRDRIEKILSRYR